MANKVSVLIDIVTDGAQDSVKKLTKSMREADTLSGKFKVGWEGAIGAVKKNAAEFAVVAGTSLVAFGVKSVKAFQDTALAAGQFSDATGLAVDEASRLIEVAGDIGIEAGTVESALGKMNKTLGASPQLFTDLGVEIAKTNTGATDVNGTFLNVVDRLNAIEDPAERARVASQLLGKGWQGMAELIGQGSSALKASLAGVADAQVIDEKELAKARNFRDRMDELKDRLGAVAMELGESLVPALAQMAENAVPAAQAVAKVADAWMTVGNAVKNTSEVSAEMYLQNGITVDQLKEMGYSADEVSAALVNLGLSAVETNDVTAEMARIYGERVIPAVDKATTLVDDLEESTAALDDAYSALIGKLDQQDAWDSFFEKMYVFHSETGRSAQETRDYTRDIVEMVRALEDVPPETKAQMIATLDAGNIAAIESRLSQLARNRVVSISGQLVGGGLRNEMEGRAAGGPVTAGTPYIVGERGPEVIVPGRSGTVIPNNRIGVGGGVNVTINMPPGSNGADVVRAIRKYERSNGAGWRA